MWLIRGREEGEKREGGRENGDLICFLSFLFLFLFLLIFPFNLSRHSLYMYKGQVDSRYDDDRSSRIQGIYISLSLSLSFSLLLLLTLAQHKH